MDFLTLSWLIQLPLLHGMYGSMIAGQCRLPSTEGLEAECKASTQICFERDFSDLTVILRWQIRC